MKRVAKFLTGENIPDDATYLYTDHAADGERLHYYEVHYPGVSLNTVFLSEDEPNGKNQSGAQ